MRARVSLVRRVLQAMPPPRALALAANVQRAVSIRAVCTTAIAAPTAAAAAAAAAAPAPGTADVPWPWVVRHLHVIA